jgi:hypothetical protein
MNGTVFCDMTLFSLVEFTEFYSEGGGIVFFVNDSKLL